MTSGIVRCNDAFARVMFAVSIAGLALALWANRANPLAAAATLGAIAPLTIAFFLLGFTSKLIVTPQELVSFNPFSIRRVPRALATGLVTVSADGTLTLDINDEDPLIVGAGVPVLWDRHRWQTRAARHIESLLDTIPAEPGGTSATIRRYPLITLALTALAALLTTALALLISTLT